MDLYQIRLLSYCVGVWGYGRMGEETPPPPPYSQTPTPFQTTSLLPDWVLLRQSAYGHQSGCALVAPRVRSIFHRSRRFSALVVVYVVLVGVVAACNRPPPETVMPSLEAAQTDTTPPGWPSSFGFGRRATALEIAAWNLDVRPDGVGLPAGSGTVAHGAELYAVQCASCHGATGVEGPNDRLVGRLPGDAFPFGTEPAQIETIGNYWPYATTLFDYLLRAMPYDAPGSLTPEEVYSLTAYLLYLNEIIPEKAVMNAQTLPVVVMPAHDRFVPDDRRGGPEIR